MNKKAVELSINFIVMLILGLALFSSCLVLLQQLFKKLPALTEEMQERIDAELEKQLTTGDAIGLYPTSAKLAPDGHTQFGIGIRNDRDAITTFHLVARCDTAIAPDASLICEDSMGLACDGFDGMLAPPGPVSIEPGDRSPTLHVLVQAPKGTRQGTYVYRIKACLDAECTEPYKVPKDFSLVVT